MDTLPNYLLETILINLAPDNKGLIDDFLQLKMVCHLWNNILNHKNFWIRFCEINNYDYFDYINYDHKLQIKMQITGFIDIKYQQKILKRHLETTFLKYYPIFNNFEIYFGNIYNFSKIQYIDVSFRLLSMLYTKEWGEDLFYNFKNKMNSYIARGLDDKNRPFIAFKYINNKKNKIIWEIIYRNEFNEWTYMGDHNSYIGLLANENRELGYDSYKYIDRLLLNKPCGYIFNKKDDNNEYKLYESEKQINNNISTVQLYTYV